MLQKILPLCFLFLMVASCKSEAEKPPENKLDRTALIDSTISNFQTRLLTQQIDTVFSKYNFNGSVAVLKKAEVIYQKVSGYEDFKSKKNLDSASVFAIASISKQFTAVLILLQEEQGKLSTEDKVSKYLAEFQPRQFENITVKELLNHTSGISDSGKGLLSKPGAQFNYSNKGYKYLGKIIEKVSGKSYDENAEELFAKHGMKNTSTATSFSGSNFAGAFLGTAKHFQMIGNMPKRLAEPAISVPAGGILSTVQDLHRWNSALYAGKILKPKSLVKFTEKSADRNHPIFGKMDYGLGIMMNVGKPRAYFHSGYVKGVPALVVYYPETQTSLIILSNIADEGKGKNAVFNPHREIKILTDAIQHTAVNLRKEMIR